MSVLFNTLPLFVTVFLTRSKCLNFMAAVISEPKKIKSVNVSIFVPSIRHEVMGLAFCDLSFLNVEFQASFFTLLFYPHQKSLLIYFHFVPLEWYHLHI